jgi:hypothetical protein
MPGPQSNFDPEIRAALEEELARRAGMGAAPHKPPPLTAHGGPPPPAATKQAPMVPGAPPELSPAPGGLQGAHPPFVKR